MHKHVQASIWFLKVKIMISLNFWTDHGISKNKYKSFWEKQATAG